MPKGKHIVLVVSGGIAAYKAAELARLFIKAGAELRVAMTESATRFITPLTFQTLTGQPVCTSLWEDPPGEINHISLADWADVVVVAPATANIIGKMAHGLADDFTATFLLATKAPVVVCPAMNVNMYDHPAVQANLNVLRSRCTLVEPASGILACGWEGKGRLADLEIIVEETRRVLTKQDLVGLSVLITAGPTREPWDDIRYISNRSSGRMGMALAQEAWRRGAKVLMVSGPTTLAPPIGVDVINVETTREMRDAVREHLEGVDIIVKSAAPGDFRPVKVTGKIKKDAGMPTIVLERNPDILKEIGDEATGKMLVGFAAEAEDLLEKAQDKLRAKNLDLVVANQIGVEGEAFGASTNHVWLIDRDGQVEEIPLLSKEAIARRIWNRVLELRAK